MINIIGTAILGTMLGFTIHLMITDNDCKEGFVKQYNWGVGYVCVPGYKQ